MQSFKYSLKLTALIEHCSKILGQRKISGQLKISCLIQDNNEISGPSKQSKPLHYSFFMHQCLNYQADKNVNILKLSI